MLEQFQLKHASASKFINNFISATCANKLIFLQIGGYSGDAGDSWNNHDHNGKPFSTYDNDNDNRGGNCASLYKGWLVKCTIIKL